MVRLSTVAAGLGILTSVQSIRQNAEQDERIANHTHEGLTGTTDTDSVDDIERKLETLVDIESKNQPSPGDKDAFTSATVDLSAGQTAQVTVEPSSGFNLRVRRIEFDRRTDHSYELNVAGDVSSVSHRAKYASPKLVSQSDRVVATVTNNSGSPTTIDFELEAWAENTSK